LHHIEERDGIFLDTFSKVFLEPRNSLIGQRLRTLGQHDRDIKALVKSVGDNSEEPACLPSRCGFSWNGGSPMEMLQCREEITKSGVTDMASAQLPHIMRSSGGD
jgi:hypothetical protein